MSLSVRPHIQSAAEYNHLLNFDLSKLDIEVQITDAKGTRTVKLSEEFANKDAVIIGQPGASTADEAANWLPKNWKDIDGASGCGAQVEGFRDSSKEFKNRKLYVLNTKLNHADVIKEKGLADIAFIHASPELLAALKLQSGNHIFTAIDPKLDAEKTYLKRVNFIIDNGVISKATTTKDPKGNAAEMLCELTAEQKQSSTYGKGSPTLYHAGALNISTTLTTATQAQAYSPRSPK